MSYAIFFIGAVYAVALCTQALSYAQSVSKSRVTVVEDGQEVNLQTQFNV